MHNSVLNVILNLFFFLFHVTPKVYLMKYLLNVKQKVVQNGYND